MKFVGNIFIFMTFLGGAVYGAELKEQAAQKKLDQQLIEAVEARSTERVRTLLLQKANPDYEDAHHEKAIFHAIENCDSNIVELLLCQRADVNQVGRKKITPLNAALPNMTIHNGRLDRVDLCLHTIDLLLYHRADLNIPSALEECIRSIKWDRAYLKYIPSPYINLAGLLLDYVVDETVTNKKGETIHDLAAKNPELQEIMDYRLKDRIAKIQRVLAEAFPQRYSLDVIGVVAQYVGKLHGS